MGSRFIGAMASKKVSQSLSLCFSLSIYLDSLKFHFDWTVYSYLADTYSLLKLGGSDYHGRGGRNESELGSAKLPVTALQAFLKVGRPIWCEAIKATMRTFLDQPSDSNLSNILRFDRQRILKGNLVLSCGMELMDRCLSIWLANDERKSDEFEALRLKLSSVSITTKGSCVTVGT